METTWTIMRRFGYGDDLTLKEDYKWPTELGTLGKTDRLSLTDEGIEFLEGVFESWVATKRSSSSPILGQKKLKQVFGVVDDAVMETLLPEYDLTPYQQKSKKLSKDGWLSFWRYQTAVQPKAALEALASLGCHELNNCVAVTPKLADWSNGNATTRSLLYGYVFGSSGSGKTSFLRHILGYPESSTNEIGKIAVAAATEMQRYNDKTIALEEVSDYESVLIDEEQTNRADLFLVVVDVTDDASIEYAKAVLDAVIDVKANKPTSIVFTNVSGNNSAKAEGLLDKEFNESVGMMNLDTDEDANTWRTSIVKVCADEISIPSRGERISSSNIGAAGKERKTETTNAKEVKTGNTTSGDDEKNQGKSKESNKNGKKDTEDTRSVQKNDKKSEEGSSWLLPITLLGLAGAGGYYWWQQQQQGEGESGEVELL
eukprot:TRINITY_DN164_c2_g1_i2.p1 TRINITY_DN164_c2_g1~~TRINITY_DN164_c2_g1_i2.p1  ORF type:complete len:429 (+),score=173.83 TRINITY_DN164_c2_g1_i2:253-1539(+)